VTGDSQGRTIARRWELAAACVGAALAVGAIVLALTTALPPSLENLASEVADGDTTIAVADGAEVVVPADWIVTRSSDAVTVRTPDGGLRALLDVVDEDAASVLAATPGIDGATRSEHLASGLTAFHADLSDGGIVAVVGSVDGGDSVRVVIELGTAADISAYRPAVGDLLEGIRV
jgi:hypothetical protein